MRALHIRLLALTIASPMILFAQATPKCGDTSAMKGMQKGMQKGMSMKDMPCSMPVGNASLDKMQANVAKIADAAEKDRWQANVSLWQIATKKPPMLTKAEFDKMQTSLDAMTANVAKITAAAEKERWQANRDLWHLMVSGTGTTPNADTTAFKSALATLTKNVAKITEPKERERWEVNRDLWKAANEMAAMRKSMMMSK